MSTGWAPAMSPRPAMDAADGSNQVVGELLDSQEQRLHTAPQRHHQTSLQQNQEQHQCLVQMIMEQNQQIQRLGRSLQLGQNYAGHVAVASAASPSVELQQSCGEGVDVVKPWDFLAISNELGKATHAGTPVDEGARHTLVQGTMGDHERSLREQVEETQRLAVSLAAERAAFEARALAAEARAAASESRAAEALSQAQRAHEAEAQKQAECEGLRGVLKAIHQAARCPILHGVYKDPVVASDGQTYDRQAFEPWLRRNGTSPFTRLPLQRLLYFPNRFAAEVLQQLKAIDLGISEAGDADEAESTASHNPQDAPEPEPEALREAIAREDEATALQLLQRPQLPGLNETNGGGSVLHRALFHRLPEVATAICARPDFQVVNAKDRDMRTALHYAAAAGLLPAVLAILGREDFRELRARSSSNETATEVAHRTQQHLVAQALEAAETS